MDRRAFIGTLAGGLVAAPISAQPRQAGKVVTIGILAIEPFPPIDSFRKRLQELGYIEGKNVSFESRYAEGRNERFRELAEDLVSARVCAPMSWARQSSVGAS